MHAPDFVRFAGVLAAGALLASCSAGGGSVSPPVAPVPPPMAPAGAALQSLAESSATRSTLSTSPSTVACTPIITVNPATHLNPTRTARFVNPDRDDFSGEHGEHGERGEREGLRNVDGTGCDYTIYLSPKSKHARINHARVHGGAHIQIVADGAEDVQIRETAVDGGQAPVVCNVFLTSCKDGVWFTFGATGSIERSYVTNASGGIVIQTARALVGETLITNTSFLAINIINNADGTVEDTYIDNSMNTGSGVAVQLASKGFLRRTTAVGRGVPSVSGPQFGYFFGHNHPTVTTNHLTAIHNQTGFGSYCAIGINSVADLTNAHDSAVTSTIANYDVNNNPVGPGCL
jgi:hypothetical protein